MSRQTKRQAQRAHLKRFRSQQKATYRRSARRDLLERQSEREKSGYYTGVSVASVISPSRSRPHDKRVIHKGQAYGRIIRAYIEDGREYVLHATKGWRNQAA